MLTAKQKADWVAALRSGEYKQGKGALRTSRGFCCLGVLAETLKAKVIKTSGCSTFQYRFSGFKQPFTVEIPERYLHGSIQAKLVDMNDNKGDSFLTIADYIEEEV